MAIIQNAITFADNPSFTKVGSIASGSSVSSATLNGIFSDTFHTYFFAYEGRTAAGGSFMQFCAANGTAATSNYYYAVQGRDQAGNIDGPESLNSGGTSGFLFGLSSTTRLMNVYGYITAPTSGTGNAKKITWTQSGFDASNNLLWRSGAGFSTDSGDYTGLVISSSSGNITVHSLQVYGITSTVASG